MMVLLALQCRCMCRSFEFVLFQGATGSQIKPVEAGSSQPGRGRSLGLSPKPARVPSSTSLVEEFRYGLPLVYLAVTDSSRILVPVAAVMATRISRSPAAFGVAVRRILVVAVLRTLVPATAVHLIPCGRSIGRAEASAAAAAAKMGKTIQKI